MLLRHSIFAWWSTGLELVSTKKQPLNQYLKKEMYFSKSIFVEIIGNWSRLYLSKRDDLLYAIFLQDVGDHGSPQFPLHFSS